MNDLTINGIDLFIATKKAKKQSSCNPLGYLTKTVLKFSRVMLYPSFLVNKPSCGEEYKYKLSSGKIHDICEVCRADPCEICGGKKPKERVRFKTCSEACQMEKRRNMSEEQLAEYLKNRREQKRINTAKRRQQRRLREMMGDMNKVLEKAQNDK